MSDTSAPALSDFARFRLPDFAAELSAEAVRHWVLGMGLSVFIGSSRMGPTSAAVTPTEQAYFQPSALRGVQLSPDGRQVGALVQSTGWAWAQWQPELSADPQVTITGNFREFVWAGNGSVIASERQAGGLDWWRLDIVSATRTRLVPSPDQTWVRVLRPAPRLSSSVLLEGFSHTDSRRSDRGRWLDVFRVPTQGGPGERVARNPGDVVEWLVDGSGEARLALAIRGRTQELRLAPGSRSGAWRTALTFDFVKDPAKLLEISADGRRAWFAARLGRDTRGVYEFDLIGQRVSRARWTDPDFDFAGRVLVSGNDLMAVVLDGERPHSEWFNPRWQGGRTANWTPLSLSDSGEFGLLGAPNVPPASSLWWWDRQRDVGQRLTWTDGDIPRIWPHMEPTEGTWEERRPFPRQAGQWLARDGVRLRGYLTLPRLPGGTKPPLVVLVHGGPWSRDLWQSPPEVSFLASRGWAVLQVNYRGSAGLGWTFQESGAGQWVRATDDLVDSARWAADLGLIDDSRMVTAGGSFGGFFSVLALTQANQPFQAAASLGGVFDLPQWLRDARRRAPDYVGLAQRELLGVARATDSDSWRVPAAKIQRPVWLVHARDDTEVDFAQSARFAESSRKAGKAVEFDPLATGGHTLGSPAQQAAVWDRVERFLRRQVEPGSPKADR